MDEPQVLVVDKSELLSDSTDIEIECCVISQVLTTTEGDLSEGKTSTANQDYLDAIDAGDLDKVQEVVLPGVDLDFKSGQPLRLASYLGHVDIIRFLLQSGASVDACDEEKKTPLHKATSQGNARVTKVLIEYTANIDTRDKLECTPLHTAIMGDHASISIVGLLLDKGADLTAKTSPNQRTAIHLASSHGYGDIVRLLLDKGADPSIKDLGGQTSLHHASVCDNPVTVQLLLEYQSEQV